MHPFFYHCFTAPEDYKNAVISCDFEKLELIGDDYIYLVMRQQSEDKLYKLYVTETLRLIAKNGGLSGGSYIEKRYSEIIQPTPPEPELSPDEIIEQVNQRAGLTMIEEGDD